MKSLQKRRSKSPAIKIGNGNIGTLELGLRNLKMPRLFYQLVVFVVDGSGSMKNEGITGKTKGEEVGDAISSIVERLKKSKNKESFDVSILAYSQDVEIVLPVTQVTEISPSRNFNPCDFVENYQTFIESAIDQAEELIDTYLEGNKNKNSQALLIILSDGALNDFELAKEGTKRLKGKERVTISSYLFEDKTWKAEASEEALQELRNQMLQLSSTPFDESTKFFKSTVDPDEVRKHMIKSITTVSNTTF